MSKRIKIKAKNRRWILHYNRIGRGHENFGLNNSINGTWPESPDGVSATQAFAKSESQGRRVETKNPESIARLTAGKKIHGLTVEMWAKDRANCLMSKEELRECCNDVPGLYEEVERLKANYYPETANLSQLGEYAKFPSSYKGLNDHLNGDYE